MTAGVVLYAPNVHTGGGIVLLHALLASCPADQWHAAFLDERARSQLVLPAGVGGVHWVRPSARSRLGAEHSLQAVTRSGDTVLCFHGLAPLLPSVGRVVVFQQNRNYLGLNPLSDFAPRTALRLGFERLVARMFRRRVSEYIVQTPTMARDLARWYGNRTSRGASSPVIRVLPFIDALPIAVPRVPARATGWDFIYVSDGEAHKNHRCLLQAWRLLAEQGLRPRLALTLGPRDGVLAQEVQALRTDSGAEVHNLGHLPRERVLELYGAARALIFPSTSESFGLPLIEAQHVGLPILAPELDYVRDVCTPAQTFDPHSPVSIARAVRRFLAQPEAPLVIGQPADLWQALLAEGASAGPPR